MAQGQVWTRPGRQKESCLVELIIYGRKTLSRLHPWAGCALSWGACLSKPSGVCGGEGGSGLGLWAVPGGRGRAAGDRAGLAQVGRPRR